MRSPTLVLGYHGCDRSFGESVLAGKDVLKASRNEWDWLGTGIYFWENSAKRAMDWAIEVKRNAKICRSPIHDPFVLGAIIDLGNCLDLLEAESIRVVERAHDGLMEIFEASGAKPPENHGQSPEQLVRKLDCAVINYVHDMQEHAGNERFDSVRAAFVEGDPLYKTAGFHHRTHIQICIRKESQILGYFRPRSIKS
jgi:hypothetical protein